MSGSQMFSQAESVFIIAEMSANHGGNYNQAVQILEAAREVGADAVKLQTYTPDTMTLDCDSDLFRIKGTIWEGHNLYDLYQEAHTPWEWQPRLKEVADQMGIMLFSTPFDVTAVDFLESMNVPCHKIASFENGDLPLIRRVAATGKPCIMSTGMATEADIREAVDAFYGAGGGELVLLKCTSAYPSPPEEANLMTIPDLGKRFGVVSGLSDHTLGIELPIAAVALGARVIEKHFCLDRSLPGPDSAFSLEPAEFRAMVDAVRIVEKGLGTVCYEVTEKQKASMVFRRSLFAVKEIMVGEPFTPQNIHCIRPAHGLHPRHYDEVMGRVAASRIKRGTPLSWELVK